MRVMISGMRLERWQGKCRLVLELSHRAYTGFAAVLDECEKLQKRMEGGKNLAVEIKACRDKRSLSSNGLCWLLCERLAVALGATKEDIYRRHIREVGVFTPLMMQRAAYGEFARIWNGRGIGWFCETEESEVSPGEVYVMAYHGSSSYDTAQMARLLAALQDSCREIGVETWPEEEVAALLASEQKRMMT